MPVVLAEPGPVDTEVQEVPVAGPEGGTSGIIGEGLSRSDDDSDDDERTDVGDEQAPAATPLPEAGEEDELDRCARLLLLMHAGMLHMT